MDIDNNTSEPVDYDVDISDGGGIEKGGGPGESVSGGKARFQINGNSTFSFHLAPGTVAVRHRFVVPATEPEVEIELIDADPDRSVAFRSHVEGGVTYYSAAYKS